MEKKDGKESTENIVRECFVKVAQLVVQSRASNHSNGKFSISKWFNVEIEDAHKITEEMKPWRTNIYTPFYLDIFLNVNNKKHLVEQWKMTHEASTSSAVTEIPTLYKKLVVMIRSLYTFLRVSPAYKLFRGCKRGTIPGAWTSHQFNTLPISSFDVITQSDKPTTFSFETTQTQLGRLTLTVTYTDAQFHRRIIPPPRTLLNSKLLISDYAPNQEAIDSRDPMTPSDLRFGSPPVATSGFDLRSSSLSPPKIAPIRDVQTQYGSPSESKPIGIPSQKASDGVGSKPSSLPFSSLPQTPSWSPPPLSLLNPSSPQSNSFRSSSFTQSNAFTSSPPITFNTMSSMGSVIVSNPSGRHSRPSSFHESPPLMVYPTGVRGYEAPFKALGRESLTEMEPALSTSYEKSKGDSGDIGQFVLKCQNAGNLSEQNPSTLQSTLQMLDSMTSDLVQLGFEV
eukprot:TRINITY_DN6870_c0_g1_i1.p1 TRINITY_DN6870_c0_g1~~TRINITY_DN6870_c0_g1_i1.p1  ORF type:complete len:453 (+),score=33.39 TRINITY_DN6870_c0_g1_i1:119-1477(+)